MANSFSNRYAFLIFHSEGDLLLEIRSPPLSSFEIKILHSVQNDKYGNIVVMILNDNNKGAILSDNYKIIIPNCSN